MLRMRIASKQPQRPECVGVGRVFGRLEADVDVALGRQVVDFVGLRFLDDADQVGGVGDVAVMQEEPGVAFVRVDVQVVDPRAC